MKSLMKIYMKYIATAIILIFIFMAIQLGILGIVAVKLYGSGNDYGKYSIRQVYEILYQAEGTAEDGWPEAVAYLEAMNVSFAMLLDQTGQPVRSYQLPEHLNHPYTVSQVASFTRWYLDDYPVSVWGGDQGLLVVGYPQGSVWNYHIHQDMRDLQGMMTFISLSFVITILAAILILLVSGYRYYRNMRGVTDAIGQLASGGSVHLSESGSMKEIAEALNSTSDRLSRQRRQLEQRDEARTEWISGVSHDIRTPLSLVMGYADMIESQPGKETEVKKRAALIRSQSIRIRNLIEDLNLASKLEYNMQPLRLKLIFPGAVLRKAAADLLNTMERPQDYPLSIEISPEVERFSMEGDEQLLFRAFQNILGNSVRHNEDGCALELRAVMENGRVMIHFHDSGCGFSEDICHYLNEGTMPEGDVHVMGLRIVRQIVKAHGGEICADGDGIVILLRGENKTG